MGEKPGVLALGVLPGETLAVQVKMGIGWINLRFAVRAVGEMLIMERVARIRREFFVKGKSIKEKAGAGGGGI